MTVEDNLSKLLAMPCHAMRYDLRASRNEISHVGMLGLR